MPTKPSYKATIDEIDFEIPIDKEGFLMIPDMNKKGEVVRSEEHTSELQSLS